MMKQLDNNKAILVKDIQKSFHLPYDNHSGVKQLVLNVLQGKRNKGYEVQKVLKSISFEVNKGDFFGIVGRNGSGKSTLLKLLAGIYEPDSGGITTDGSIVPFIELGVGFNPELTGRENIFLNGALLGFSRDEIRSMYDDIVEFAELDKFMDQKLKNYSSGMQVRLAFSIAIQAKGDILILDEVLAVGDEAFQRKCYAYFSELKRTNKTVILVTHSMDSVQRFCNKAILINEGKIIESGNPARVAEKYIELNEEKLDAANTERNNPKVNEHGVSATVKVDVTDDSLMFEVEVGTKEMLSDTVITFMINNEMGESVYRWASDDEDRDAKISITSEKKLKIHLELENIFPDGKFDIQLGVKKYDRSEVYALFNQLTKFKVVNPDIKKRNTHWKPKEKYSYE